jgi:hypothetical protein
MPLTQDFKKTIRARLERDPKFRKELLRESIESLFAGDIATAKTVLLDYINARLYRTLSCNSDTFKKPHANAGPVRESQGWQPFRSRQFLAGSRGRAVLSTDSASSMSRRALIGPIGVLLLVIGGCARKEPGMGELEPGLREESSVTFDLEPAEGGNGSQQLRFWRKDGAVPDRARTGRGSPR